MKKLNLIEWLSRNSHEKQSPQRFFRYAVMLIMLLTLGVGQMWAGMDVTVYYAVPESTVGSYTVKCNVKLASGESGAWKQTAMERTGHTYDGDPIYSCTYADSYSGAARLQFQFYNGNTWVSQTYAIGGDNSDNWTGAYDNINNKLWVHGTSSNSSWSTYCYDTYYVNTNNWGSVYAYACNDGSDKNAEWPGVAMTNTGKVDENNKSIYRILLSKNYDYIIFHNNSGTQTDNLTLGNTNAGKMYNNGDWDVYPCWYWIDGNGAQNGSENITKQRFEETATSGVYILTRTMSQNQTFHLGNCFSPYGPSSNTNVTGTSSNLSLNRMPPTYAYSFTDATKEVIFTLNTNNMTLSLASVEEYAISYYDEGGSAFSGVHGGGYPTTHTYGTATDLVSPTKTGYVFEGWYTNSSCSGDAVTSLGATAYDAAINLYAKWKALPIVYILKSKGTYTALPHGFTSLADASKLTLWAWSTAGGNPNFYVSPKTTSYPGPSASEINDTYEDEFGDEWYRFIPNNTDNFNSSTSYGVIVSYDGDTDAKKIYASNGTHLQCTDGSTKNTRTETDTYTGSVWIIPQGTGQGSAILYTEKPATLLWSLHSDGLKVGDFDEIGEDTYQLTVLASAITNYGAVCFSYNGENYKLGNCSLHTEYYSPETAATLTQGPGNFSWTGSPTGQIILTIFKSSGDWKIYYTPSYQVTYDDNGATTGTVPTDANYYTSGTPVTIKDNSGSLVKTGYNFAGWNGNATGTGTDYTPAGTFSISDNTTLYAKWTPKNFSITYKDQGDAAFSGVHASGYPTSHTYNTATALKSASKFGYTFDGWFTSSACTGSAVTELGATDYTADIVLYAKWGENPSLTGLVLSTSLVTTGNTFTATPTIDAGDGRTTIVCWEVQTAAGVKLDPQPSISTEEGNAVTITAPAALSSYKVVATLREGSVCNSGTVLDTEEQSFTVEGHYTVTITNGSGSSSVGEVTTATATANPAAAGMKFDHWNVTGTITEYTSGSATTSSITFRASSNIELTAVYAEDYSTGWYLATDAFDAGSWVAEKTEFLKRTGETTGSIAYVSYDLNRTTSYYSSSNLFRFKIQDTNASKTWGKPGRMTVSNCTDWAMEDVSKAEVTDFYVTVTGTYTFKLDYTTGSEKISVIYPIVNQLQVYTTTGTDGATIINDYDWTQTAGVYSQELELEEATTYTFKVVKNSVHYGVTATLSASNKSATVTTDGGDISLTTTIAGTYTISYNPTTDEVSVSLNDESTTNVAVEYGWGGLTKNVTVGDFTYPTITATVPDGMNFDSWTHTGTVTYGSSTSSETTITSATSGAKVTATFNSEKIIYFDNSASNWNDENGIWVYLFSSTDGVWWDEEINGGVHPQHNILEANRMTRIGTSDIYYYKYSTNTTIAGVAFTQADQRNYYSFNGTSAAWLTSFNTCTPCYIASAEYTSKNSTGYHSTGYWKKYGTTDPGVSLWIYYNSQWHENKFTNTDPTSFIYTTSETLTSAASDYAYHVERCNGEYLIRSGYDGHIAPSDSDYPRELTPKGSKPDGKITTTSAGEYNFTLDLSGGHIYMYTEYPLNVGDYRVVLNNGTKNHPSGKIIRAKTESVSDTVSFFINKDATNTLHVDTCYSTDPLAWRTIADVSASQLSLDKKPYTGTTGVYNFLITHSRYKDVSLDSITDEKKVYTGNYYIRTDAAEGKWKTYITTPDNKMQHSAKSLNTEAQFDYYFTKWVLRDANVQFTIANDYSPCISDTLYGDTYTGGADESHQTLLADANVRYMWNSGTNTISRAYLDGATAVGSQFIVLHSSDGKLFSSSATNLEHGDALTYIVFTDTKNWIYQADVKALPNAVATLTAEYNDEDINIISGGKAQKLFGGDSEDDETLYPLRMVYDFKTNILVSAWIAESDQALGATNLALDADLMIVRKLQEPAAQITFTTGSLSDVKTIYGALRFDYDDMVTHLSSWTGNYGKLLYDVSFPFDVNVKDIFGVGNMDDHWVVQKYNGARRAKEGWFQESKPFWETLTEDSVMHAYEGYTVIIDRPSFNNSESVVWKNKEEGSSVYLYFPSASVDSKTISRGDVTIHLDSLNCKKDQTFEHPETHQILNHKFTDSNWRMLGVPLLSDTTGNFSSLFKSSVDYTAENPFGYLYTWSTVDNSYSITSTSDFTFKAMHSYMVQFAGDVTFKGSYVHKAPSRIVAAKRTEDERHYTVKLQMANANIDDVTSQTYVELRENACDTFALNEDVYMVRSSNIADLYTFAGAYDVAANVLSVGNHVVPVGMDVKQAGMYTFSMPSDFSGTVTLVDTQAGTRTNLSLNSYEIYLNRGAINNRFYLDIDIQEVITSVENVEGSNAINDGGAHKFLQNGQMYILKNGVIYDAKGNRVK